MTDYTHVTAYLRVSSTEQTKGTGLDGQRLDVEAMARHLGVTIDTELVEGGRSGFHAKHRAEGGVFHAYEQDVKAGLHHGSLLILSKLDRLTRENSDEASDLMRTLSRHGVTIATADDKEVYQAGVPKRLDQGIKALLKIEVGHEEQAKKAERLRRAYDVRHERCRIAKLAVTKNVMPWIIVKANRTMVLDDARAGIVRQMFEWADQGLGALGIAKKLEAMGVAHWTARKSKAAKTWTRTHVTKILTSRVCIGEFQPHRDGKANGDPWLDHFPRVVDHELFERVNRNAKVRKQSSVTNRDEKIVNLVAGLATCSCCGSNMVYQRGRAAGTEITTKNGSTYRYSRDNGSLVCPTGVMNKAKCPNSGYIAYLTFERTLLDACLHLAMDDNAFARKDEVGRLNILIAERERELEVALEKATNLAMRWAARPSEINEKLANDAEDAATALSKNVKALHRQRDDAKGKVSDQEHLARVAEIRANLYHDDLELRVTLRRKVQQSLRSLIDEIRFDADRVATVSFAGGLAALQIQKGKVIKQANALAMFRKGDFSALDIEGQNITPITAAARRLEKTLTRNGVAGYAGAGPEALEAYTIAKVKAAE